MVIHHTILRSDGSSYRLPIVIALSLTIRPQFGIKIECLQHLNQHAVSHLFGSIFGVFHLDRSPMMLGSAESEHPRLTNCEISFEKFQVITIPQCHRQIAGPGRTDRQTYNLSYSKYLLYVYVRLCLLTCGNKLKIYQDHVHYNLRKYFFANRVICVICTWNSLAYLILL